MRYLLITLTMAKNEKVTISEHTGLTPTQEKAADLLASGVSVTDVAERIGIARSTLYVWQKQITFKVYFNKRCSDARSTLVVGLFGLADEALQTIRESLKSENETLRLKAAMWITDKLQSMEISQTDLIATLQEENTYEDAETWARYPYLHKDQYKARLKELGVKEPDYRSTLK